MGLVPYERDPRELLQPPPLCKDTEKIAIYEPGRESHQILNLLTL